MRQKEREKILYSCAKINIEDNEIFEWVTNNIEAKEFHTMTTDQLQQYLPFEKWKTMIINIKSERRKKLKERLKSPPKTILHDEFEDTAFDIAL